MKKYITILFTIILLSIFTIPVMAEKIFEDTFMDATKIDTKKTTALVDTVLGEISLQRKKIPNALAVKEMQNEFALINGEQINYYSFDAATNALQKNELLSISDITDPVGIALGENDYSLWVLTETEVRRYDYTENGMSHNPYLSMTGLTDVFSISSNPLDGTVAVLSKDSEGKGVVSTYKTTEEGKLEVIPQLSINTGFEDPSSISMVPNTSDLVVSAGDSTYYYSYESQSNSYVQNVMMSVATGSPVTSLCVQKSGDSYAVVTAEGSDYYTYDIEISQMNRIPTLSTSSSNYSYAVSLKQGGYEYAMLTEDGQVQYWMFDEGTGSMVRNSAMEIASVDIKNRYYSPRDYVSNAITSTRIYDEVKLTSTEEKPEGTAIKWNISTDEGATWKEVAIGQWVDINQTNTLIIKAVLTAAESMNQPTPKIMDIAVEATMVEFSKIECIAITKNHSEQVLPTDQFPVKAKKGSQVVFAVHSFGFTQNVSAKFSTGEEKDLIPEKNPAEEEKNIWIGTISFEPDAAEGQIIGVVINGVKNSKKISKEIENFININQTVIYNMDIRLVR